MIGRDAARRVRLLGLDVDGVLTPGSVLLGSLRGEPVELKEFDIRDGLGIVLARRAGIAVALVSGRESGATAVRAAELGVDELVQDAAGHKLPGLQAILRRRGLEWADVAFVGDDLPDLPVLRRAGVPVAVANAIPEVRAAAAYVTTAPGGAGAVREAVEALLRARDGWEDVVSGYLREREAVA